MGASTAKLSHRRDADIEKMVSSTTPTSSAVRSLDFYKWDDSDDHWAVAAAFAGALDAMWEKLHKQQTSVLLRGFAWPFGPYEPGCMADKAQTEDAAEQAPCTQDMSDDGPGMAAGTAIAPDAAFYGDPDGPEGAPLGDVVESAASLSEEKVTGYRAGASMAVMGPDEKQKFGLNADLDFLIGYLNDMKGRV